MLQMRVLIPSRGAVHLTSNRGLVTTGVVVGVCVVASRKIAGTRSTTAKKALLLCCSLKVIA